MSIAVYISGDSGAVSVGADDVAFEVQQQAKQRGLDVEIIRTSARGLYWLEPLVEVETQNGRVGYGPIEARDVASLLDAGFENGQPHASFVESVEEIPFLARQDRQIFQRAGKTQPLDLPDYIRTGGFSALKKALEIGPEAILEQVRISGLRGRGGAGFPAGIKWKTVAEQKELQKYVCCNADEGDSGTFADRMVMEGDPFALIEAMMIAGFAIGADKGLIYVRSEYPGAIKTLKSAIRILLDAGWLGPNISGSSLSFSVEVRRGAGSYVCGEESAMLESLEGKRGQVRVKPPIPAISGLFGKPTLVHNVLTLASIPAIITGGAKTYEKKGTRRSRGTQAF
ncbi:MAG TPA: formate dehydrogenase beta subunit, partial [Devosia sp.]|nr:formate dehydrogenase beta subunit [Devosia sp.]